MKMSSLPHRSNGINRDNETTTPHEAKEPIEIDLLIIGAGVAGSALAAFLASYGLKGLVVSDAPGTTYVPKAHVTNPAALGTSQRIDG